MIRHYLWDLSIALEVWVVRVLLAVGKSCYNIQDCDTNEKYMPRADSVSN